MNSPCLQVFAAVAVLTMGCGKGDKAPAPRDEQSAEITKGDQSAAKKTDTDKTDKTDKTPPPAHEVRHETSRPPTGDKAKIPVTMTLPAGWSETEYEGLYAPFDDKYLATGSQISLSAQCQGSCSAKDLASNIDSVIATLKTKGNRPNFGTGDPNLDNVRGGFEVLQERDLPLGKLIAYRLTFSKEILASGPYEEAVRVLCLIRRPTDEYYIEYQGRATLADEARRLPELISACESIAIAEPAPAEEAPAEE